MYKLKRILSAVATNFFLEKLIDTIFLSFALFFLFPHVQWVWNSATVPKTSSVWSVFINDWQISHEAYLIGAAIIAIWFVVKWLRYKEDSKEHKNMTHALDSYRDTLNNNDEVLNRVLALLEKIEKKP